MSIELLKNYPVVIELPVVWGEMDSFRHVNNVVYFRYFETARVEYFRRLGWMDPETHGGVGPILASIEARFRKPLTYPDTISIGVRVASLQRDRLTMEHEIASHGQNAITTEGKALVVCFDYRAGRKAAIPDDLRRRIGAMEGREFDV